MIEVYCLSYTTSALLPHHSALLARLAHLPVRCLALPGHSADARSSATCRTDARHVVSSSRPGHACCCCWGRHLCTYSSQSCWCCRWRCRLNRVAICATQQAHRCSSEVPPFARRVTFRPRAAAAPAPTFRARARTVPIAQAPCTRGAAGRLESSEARGCVVESTIDL